MAKNTKEKQSESNPILFKLAIPLALSLAGIIIFTLTRKSRTKEKPSRYQHQMDCPESMSHYEFEDEEDSSEEDDDDEAKTLASTHLLESAREISIEKCIEGSNSEEEIEGLRCQVASLEERHSVLESQFYDYWNMNELESVYQKFQIMCLGLKLKSLESQNQRLEGVIAMFRGARKQVDVLRAEIKLIQRKCKKLTRANRECSNLIRSNEEYYRATKEIKEVADRLPREIKAVEEKLEIRASKQQQMEEKIAEDKTRLDNAKLSEQLQQLREQWSADMEELIYLGWINACLRREILIIQEEEEEEEYIDGEDDVVEEAKPVAELGDEVVMELPYDEHVENCSVEFYDTKCPLTVADIEDVSTTVAARSRSRSLKKRRLLHKIKVWATGKGRCKSACSKGKILESWPCSNS